MKEVFHIAPDLAIREVTLKDAPAIYFLIDAYRPYLREWLPFIDYSNSEADTLQFLKNVTAPSNQSDWVFAILYAKEIAGIIGYKSIDHVNKKLEIGYWLGEPFQGKGIMQRACTKLIEHAFTKMGMNRIQIKVGVGNHKSSRIPQKLGFMLEGVERAGELIRENFIDLQVYSLLKSEWQEKAQQLT